MPNKKAIVHKPVRPEIGELAQQYQNDPEAIVEIFKVLQQRPNGLQTEYIKDVAKVLGIPAQHAYGVASFYTMLETPHPQKTIRICDGVACWLQGSGELQKEAAARLADGWVVERSSCLGLCDHAPSALVADQQVYNLNLERLADVVQGWRGDKISYATPRPGETRVLLADIDKIDPYAIESALEHGAYQGLARALTRTPQSVVADVEAAGLLGRGGAGFPAGVKWRYVAQEISKTKYVVCNADESEPLAFKDRVLIEHKPHQLLEGMALAGFAVGASEGYIYIRGEYAAQADLLEQAIQQAEGLGWLGENIQGTDFSFHVHVHRGAGAYICGEETALLNSLEGKRGEPRIRPPYPTVSGLHGKPTVVNNVETLSNVPAIVRHGAEWYRGLSATEVPGTKLYAVLGHVNQSGLFEAPFGLTLRQIVEEFGGGLRPGSQYNFALSGGAAGYLVPPDLLDVPIYYTSWEQGVALGVGAYLVCDQSVSPLVLLRQLMHFFEMESCGKCTPCRMGTHRSGVILDQMLAGDDDPALVQELKDLAALMKSASFCGLGVSAAWPIESLFLRFPQVLGGSTSGPTVVKG